MRRLVYSIESILPLHMLEIDGSMGEGGGQIIRTAVALSSLTGKDVRITNIRANRSKKGLRPQHVSAVSAIAEICGGTAKGISQGSEEITYCPGNSNITDYSIDIGTAGSISLVFQACALAALNKSQMHMNITGGTNVYYAPSIDYCEHILFYFLSRMGYDITLNSFSRGFHPEGGGNIDVTLTPAPLMPLDLRSRGELLEKGGLCYVQNLPRNVGERLMSSSGINNLQCTKGPSDGAGIFMYARYENTILGMDSLGRKGLPSEKVASLALERINQEMFSPSTLDVYAADQLLPYMALAKGNSHFIVKDISNHLQTQMDLISKFVDVEYEISKLDGASHIAVMPRYI